MTINILKLRTDETGTDGWALVGTQDVADVSEALACIQALNAEDGCSYRAEITVDIGSQQIAQVP